MRPISLELENFMPYRGRHRIDFFDHNIIAITGPTGAGKSSIIDAISFALFGKIPRYGQSQPDIISYGKDKARVVLEFIANKERYKIIRDRRKDGKGSTKTQFQLYDESGRIISSNSVREFDEKIRKILSLSYETFIRSVILPQGQFDRFLKAKPSDRIEILLEIAGLGIYDILREKFSEKKIEMENEYKNKNLFLSELVRMGYTEDTIAQIDNEIEENKKKYEALAQEKRNKEENLEQLRRFYNIVVEIEKLTKLKEDLEVRIASASKELDWIENSLVKASEKFEYMKGEYNRIEILSTEKAVLDENARYVKNLQDKIKEVSEKKKQIDSIIREKENTKSSLEENKKRIESLEAEVVTVEKRLKELPSSEEIDELWERVQQYERLCKEVEKIKKDIMTVNKQLEELSYDRDRIEQELSIIEKKKDEIKNQLNKAEMENMASAIRSKLKEGEICPVCGNVYIGFLEEEKVSVAQLDKLRTEMERIEREEDSRKRAIERIKTEYDLIAEKIQNLKKDKSDRENDMKEIEKGLKKYKSRDEVKILKEEISNLNKSLQELGKEILKCSTDISHQNKRIEQYEKFLEDVINDAKNREAEVESIKKILQDKYGYVNVVKDPSSVLENIRRRRLEIESEIKHIKSEYESAEREQRRLENIRAKKNQEIKDFESRLEETEIRLNKIKKEVEGPDSETIKKEIETNKKEIDRIISEMEDLQKNIGKKEIEEREIAEKINRRRIIEKEIKTIEEELGVLKQLTNEFKKGAGSVQSYAVSLIIDKLIFFGSDALLRFSNGRFRFVNDNGEISIRDTWNNEMNRNPDSLSGGESFMVSLSLALSLAQTITEGRFTESFFIDEGFSTLDDESLEKVTEILETLSQSTKKLIVIVSHIKELAERFPRIVVEKNQDTSEIKFEEEV